MAEASNTTVTLQVHRFTPRPERAERARGGSPFAKKGSPFGGGSDSAARRRPRGKQWVQEYTIPARPSDTVLDCLLTIKRTVDPTLAFRYSCGHGMCGSDAVAINGTPTLLCTATIRDWAKQPGAMPEVDDEGFRHTGTEAEESDDSAENVANAAAAQNSAANGSLGVIELASLPGFPPQRDLIADIDPMLNQIRKLTPYLQADGVLATTAEGKVDVFEYLQNPEQLAKYELLSNCIACGVCEGACPVYAGGDAFIGPAALIWASRFVNDSRATKAMERMDAIDTADGVAACQSVRACSRHCPRGIDVGEEMWQLLGHDNTIAYEPWPTYDEAKCKDQEVTMAVQVNGKMRGTVLMDADLDNDTVVKDALADEKIARFLEKQGGSIVKTIVVKNKLVNLIVK